MSNYTEQGHWRNQSENQSFSNFDPRGMDQNSNRGMGSHPERADTQRDQGRNQGSQSGRTDNRSGQGRNQDFHSGRTDSRYDQGRNQGSQSGRTDNRWDQGRNQGSQSGRTDNRWDQGRNQGSQSGRTDNRWDQGRNQSSYSNRGYQGAYQKMDDTSISRALSSILRHKADSMYIDIDSGGFVYVDDILKLKNFAGVTCDDIHRVVVNNDKKRFYIKIKEETERWVIRANQGHSMIVQDLELQPIIDIKQYPVALHGTYYEAWTKIKTQGLKRFERAHIHFAAGLPGNDGVISGMRNSCEIMIFLNLEKALEEGIKFFLSANKVILSSGDETGKIEPKYFLKTIDRYTGRDITNDEVTETSKNPPPGYNPVDVEKKYPPGHKPIETEKKYPPGFNPVDDKEGKRSNKRDGNTQNKRKGKEGEKKYPIGYSPDDSQEKERKGQNKKGKKSQNEKSGQSSKTGESFGLHKIPESQRRDGNKSTKFSKKEVTQAQNENKEKKAESLQVKEDFGPSVDMSPVPEERSNHQDMDVEQKNGTSEKKSKEIKKSQKPQSGDDVSAKTLAEPEIVKDWFDIKTKELETEMDMEQKNVTPERKSKKSKKSQKPESEDDVSAKTLAESKSVEDRSDAKPKESETEMDMEPKNVTPERKSKKSKKSQKPESEDDVSAKILAESKSVEDRSDAKPKESETGNGASDPKNPETEINQSVNMIGGMEITEETTENNPSISEMTNPSQKCPMDHDSERPSSPKTTQSDWKLYLFENHMDATVSHLENSDTIGIEILCRKEAIAKIMIGIPCYLFMFDPDVEADLTFLKKMLENNQTEKIMFDCSKISQLSKQFNIIIEKPVFDLQIMYEEDQSDTADDIDKMEKILLPVSIEDVFTDEHIELVHNVFKKNIVKKSVNRLPKILPVYEALKTRLFSCDGKRENILEKSFQKCSG